MLRLRKVCPNNPSHSSILVDLGLLNSKALEPTRSKKTHWKRLARESGKLAIKVNISGAEMRGSKRLSEDASVEACADGGPSKFTCIETSS